jgi:pyruvate dehydrogenase complex dehydrogenase (E1) component
VVGKGPKVLPFCLHRRVMLVEQKDVFYYVTLMSENYT